MKGFDTSHPRRLIVCSSGFDRDDFARRAYGDSARPLSSRGPTSSTLMTKEQSMNKHLTGGLA
ncbi:hypothetical protein, partial [Variovorax sp. WS11]|uniref:hypothetical protein n=1 Tax=Variovorax sp. WS11 TaxID=1105204 RepID=UPI001C638212